MARLLRPTPRTTPDEWAAKNRIYPRSSAIPGPRDPQLTPYAVAWSRGFEWPGIKRNVLVCGAQMGKTNSTLDVIGQRLDQQPQPILYVGPSKEFVTDQFEPRLTELFHQSPSLGSQGSRRN